MNAKTYALDVRERGSYTNHNGHAVAWDEWKHLTNLSASRSSAAIKQGESMRPGAQIRARLVGTVEGGAP